MISVLLNISNIRYVIKHRHRGRRDKRGVDRSKGPATGCTRGNAYIKERPREIKLYQRRPGVDRQVKNFPPQSEA